MKRCNHKNCENPRCCKKRGRMSNEQILALLEMIEPYYSDEVEYKGGSVAYDTARAWAEELIELRALVKAERK